MKRLHTIFLLLTLTACTANPPVDTASVPAPAAARSLGDTQLYDAGKAALQAGDYGRGIDPLETLTLRYPMAGHAQRALLETADDLYRRGQANTAIAAAEGFIAAQPAHPQLDYAYYERGLLGFQNGMAALTAAKAEQAAPQDTAPARRAFQYLAELVQRFPASRFTPDAKQRMLELRNTLAQHELNIAKHYLEQRDYANAATRAKYIVDNYQQSPVISDALAIMTKAGAAAQTPAANAPAPTPPATDAPVAANMQPAAPAMPAPSKPVVAPETASSPPEHSKNVERETWLAAQNPGYYTVQLMSAGDEALLLKFVKTRNIEEKTAYFRNDSGSYALLYGIYPTEAEARDAAKALSKDLDIAMPWIRGLRAIQESIKKTGGTR
ncbi:MAG: outer membrane protein assembly factor BamD [Gammaproteobacteria bacterium]|nr:outer membrane protein assembly factor BamD [Gammaproteobacteria bacterium]